MTTRAGPERIHTSLSRRMRSGSDIRTGAKYRPLNWRAVERDAKLRCQVHKTRPTTPMRLIRFLRVVCLAVLVTVPIVALQFGTAPLADLVRFVSGGPHDRYAVGLKW